MVFIHADVDVSEARPGEENLFHCLTHGMHWMDKGRWNISRGSYWYVKKCWISGSRLQKYSRLFFGNTGGGAAGKVFVNGEFVVSHEGGYSAFRADITEKMYRRI